MMEKFFLIGNRVVINNNGLEATGTVQGGVAGFDKMVVVELDEKFQGYMQGAHFQAHIRLIVAHFDNVELL